MLREENKMTVLENNTQRQQVFLPGACTCMTLTSKSGKHYWFRTCDIETDIFRDGAHVVQQPAGKEITFFEGKKEIVKYQYTGMTYNREDTWLLDGVNEWGLTGGLLMLNEGTSVEKAGIGRNGYIGMELVSKFLSCCKDVQEVMALADKIQILNIPYGSYGVPATMHYFFVDTTGEEVILEAADAANPGILKKYSHKDILGVMTNSPVYPKQLQNLSWFLSMSPEMKQGLEGQAIRELQLDGRSVQADEEAEHLSLNGTFPGSYSSYDRFIRIAVLKALNHCGNQFEDEKMLALGSNLMNTVFEPESQGVFHYSKIEKDGRILGQKNSKTQYIIMYDCEEKSFYLRPFDEILWERYGLERKEML